MPTFISFSDEDLARDKLVEPGWYVLEIQSHRTWTPSRDGQSNNCYYETVIVSNADNGTVDYAGVPIELLFNDKKGAQGFIRGFLRALGVDLQSNTRYDLEQAVGKRVVAMIVHNEFQGRITNKADNKFRPIG